HRRASEQRRDMPPSVDRGNVKGIGKAVEGERAGQRDHVAAVDQTATEPALRRRILIEMDARGALIEPGCDLVLRLFYGDAGHVIDFLADGVIAEAIGTAGKHE